MTSEPVWRFMDYREIKDLDDADDVYLRRWYVLTTPLGGVMLHNILRPDNKERALHDHPWSFLSLILRGGYTEERPALGGYRRRTLHYRTGSVNAVRAEGLHRIAEIHGSCWTLVLHGRRRRVWGFSERPGEWTDWKTYLGVPA